MVVGGVRIKVKIKVKVKIKIKVKGSGRGRPLYTNTSCQRKRPGSFLNVAFIYRGLPAGTTLVSLNQDCWFGRGRRRLQMHLIDRDECGAYNLV